MSYDLEEAYGGLVLYARDAVLNGSRIIVIKTNDTDVIVFGISYYFKLKALSLSHQWITCGTGSDSRYISIHAIAESLG